ncbi:hypothetical protein B0F90DRAFT_1688981 [Multifurca ochricompacta]|uniref:Uncharacterized protein n=1 Tax=Multifurca ochricompacta TaxID=376703 RepID=A0AAD4M9M0_9AGAM|nr:hypothetical protein B0F90DRAFT_1688981 [Multifurca ochricompacta]
MDSLVHGSGLFEGQYPHLTVDPLVSSFQSPDSITSFPPVVGSSLTDTNIPAHPVPAFSDTINPAAALAVPSEVALPSDPRHMDISPTEVHQPTLHHDPAPPPGPIVPFHPSLRESFPSDQTFDVPRPAQSSPAATSVSSFASHTSSPAIPGLNPAYATMPSASIASAMDSMGLPGRSRSGSAASPGRFMGSGSDLAFPSVTSTEELAPDLAAPHMIVVDDMLKNIMQTANQARADCSAGQTANAGVKIDQLRKTIALVSELITAMRLVDGPSPPSDKTSPPARASPPNLPRSGACPPFAPLLPNGDPQSQDGLGPLDHESRKRCASTMNEDDRVMKAMKMEPTDDISQPSLSSFPFPASVGPGSTSVVNSHPAVSFSSNPPSSPPSRPTSSSGLPLHPQLNLYQRTLPSSVPITFPPSLNVAAATVNGHSSSDFTPPTSATHPSVAGHVTPFGHPPESWGEYSAPFAPSHRHTLSGSHPNGDVDMKNIIIGDPSAFASNSAVFPSPPAAVSLSTSPAATVAPSSLLQSTKRVSRSNSLSNPPSSDPFAFNVPLSEAVIDERAEYFAGASRPDTGFSRSHSPVSSPEDDDEHDSDTGSPGNSRYQGMNGSVGEANHQYSRPLPRRALANRASTDNLNTAIGSNGSSSSSGSNSHSNEVPQEYRAEVDRIFFEFLNKTCSNLDATDAKGEPIHQTLMAKKMQRLDESPDFRPFKFRIQAFTNAFLEEIRNYLWNSPYISRFNEDGKKAKSKGNHIWNIEAKKTGDGGWTFRPFQRRLAGVPPGVAYVGLRWTWTPRIWDPQASRNNLHVTYTSPSLPPWLSWHEDQYLTGVPTLDAQSCDVTIDARFMQDGKEEFLSQTVHITIAPVANVDTSFSNPSRQSLVDESSRRIVSDPIGPQQTSPSRPPPLIRPQTATLAPPPPQPVPSQDAQVIQVLTAAAQRVAQEAQSQVVAAGAPSEPGHELQALAKQQHVLTVTAQAVDDTVFAQGSSIAQPSSMLAAAAQQVVLQAARQVAADRSAIAAAQISAGLPASPAGAAGQVTVNEVSVATQSAVAQAVELTGPLSSEVDVLMTASSLLQAQQAQSQAQAQAQVQAQVQAQAQVVQSRPVPAPTVGVTLRHHSSFSSMPIPATLSVPLSHPPEGNLIVPVLPVSSMDLTVYSQHS